MERPADQLAKYKFSAKYPLKDSAEIVSVGPQSPGDILRDIINENHPTKLGNKVISANDKLLDHNLNRQRFSLRFLSLVVLPATFLVGVVVSDEKIKTSCFGMVSLIVGALIQESGSQRNPKVDDSSIE